MRWWIFFGAWTLAALAMDVGKDPDRLNLFLIGLAGLLILDKVERLK